MAVRMRGRRFVICEISGMLPAKALSLELYRRRPYLHNGLHRLDEKRSLFVRRLITRMIYSLKNEFSSANGGYSGPVNGNYIQGVP